jgi:hypothetical protein
VEPAGVRVNWIKVSEQKPEHYAPIIAWIPKVGSIEIGHLEVMGDRLEILQLSDEWGDWYLWSHVTHWMPWPKPPKDEAGD